MVKIKLLCSPANKALSAFFIFIFCFISYILYDVSFKIHFYITESITNLRLRVKNYFLNGITRTRCCLFQKNKVHIVEHLPCVMLDYALAFLLRGLDLRPTGIDLVS